MRNIALFSFGPNEVRQNLFSKPVAECLMKSSKFIANQQFNKNELNEKPIKYKLNDTRSWTKSHTRGAHTQPKAARSRPQTKLARNLMQC